jgi:hypothetical protein
MVCTPRYVAPGSGPLLSGSVVVRDEAAVSEVYPDRKLKFEVAPRSDHRVLLTHTFCNRLQAPA